MLSAEDRLSSFGGSLGLETAADHVLGDADILKFGQNGNALNGMLA